MYCATKTEVNDLGENVDYKYGEKEIGLPIYMDNILKTGELDEVKKE